MEAERVVFENLKALSDLSWGEEPPVPWPPVHATLRADPRPLLHSQTCCWVSERSVRFGPSHHCLALTLCV